MASKDIGEDVDGNIVMLVDQLTRHFEGSALFVNSTGPTLSGNLLVT